MVLAGSMGRRGEVEAGRAAAAFAPGHVTGLFAPSESGQDPRARGSVGAGIVLSLGATATARYRPGGARRVVVTGETPGELPISTDVADRLLARRRGELSVSIVHDLPIGQGLGMSAAGALATALAVAQLVGVPRERAIEVAHLADLFGGGGLGGVAAILGGGLEVRSVPGIPPWGSVRHRAFKGPIFVVIAGPPIPTREALADPGFLARAEASAHGPLVALRRRADPERFFTAAEAFTDAIGLARPELLRAIAELRGARAWVAQAMFGNCLFALPESPGGRDRLIELLEARRWPAIELAASPWGPGLRRVEPAPRPGPA